MKDNIIDFVDSITEIEIVPLLGPKCPRCYMKVGIEDNFMSMCDRCCDILVTNIDDYTLTGRLSLEEAQLILDGIKTSRLNQLEKYAKRDTLMG